MSEWRVLRVGVKGRGGVAPSGGGIGGFYTKFLYMEYNRDLAAKTPLLGGVSVRWSCWKG